MVWRWKWLAPHLVAVAATLYWHGTPGVFKVGMVLWVAVAGASEHAYRKAQAMVNLLTEAVADSVLAEYVLTITRTPTSLSPERTVYDQAKENDDGSG